MGPITDRDDDGDIVNAQSPGARYRKVRADREQPPSQALGPPIGTDRLTG